MDKKLQGEVPVRHEHMFALKDVSENEDTGTKGVQGWEVLKRTRKCGGRKRERLIDRGNKKEIKRANGDEEDPKGCQV